MIVSIKDAHVRTTRDMFVLIIARHVLTSSNPQFLFVYTKFDKRKVSIKEKFIFTSHSNYILYIYKICHEF